MVLSMSDWMLSGERTSTWMAVAVPPAATISRVTVVMVDSDDLGSGLDGMGLEGSLMVFAATTTVAQVSLVKGRHE